MHLIVRNAILAGILAGSLPAATPPPNVIVVLVDDLGWMDLGCQGSDFYRTPNIDRLAATGMRFTDGYASCAVCSPTRAALMTGRSPARLGITDWIRAEFQLSARQWPNIRDRFGYHRTGSADRELLTPVNELQLPHSEITLAELLKPIGYASAFIGKWHLGFGNRPHDLDSFTMPPGIEVWGFVETLAAFNAQGRPTENAPLRSGKGYAYEGGLRTPWIVRWPGVTKAGTVSREPIASIDLLPTIAAAVGTRPPADRAIDGIDLGPALQGGKLPDRALVWHFPHYRHGPGHDPYSVIRQGDLKLIRFYDPAKTELYNLANDLGETNDLAGSMQAEAGQLEALLDNHLQDVGARLPIAPQ